MVVDGLIKKLMQAAAVEKHGKELAFSNSFRSYLVECVDGDPARLSSLQSWRVMLGKYDPSLALLSIQEVHVILSLLNYQLNHPQPCGIER